MVYHELQGSVLRAVAYRGQVVYPLELMPGGCRQVYRGINR